MNARPSLGFTKTIDGKSAKFESSRPDCLLQRRQRGQNRSILNISQAVYLPLKVCEFDTKIHET